MCIYPYVYQGTHPTTGEFYIGSRVANTKPACDDLGSSYKTSSKSVLPRFGEFSWVVLAEFFDKDSAYDFEQDLIHQSWGNPLMLNRSCYKGKGRFNRYNATLSAETKEKISIAKRGKSRDPELMKRLGELNKGRHPSDETRAKMSQNMRGILRSPETKERMKEAWKLRKQNQVTRLMSNV